MRVHRATLGVIVLSVVLLVQLVGCTGHHPTTSMNPSSPSNPSDQAEVLPMRAFSSCADALAGLRGAAENYVGINGVGNAGPDGPASGVPGPVFNDPYEAGPRSTSPGTAASTGTPGYSATNDQEAGVDEPDIVKTDGRRIVTINGDRLTVVDAASRTVTGTANLADPSTPPPPQYLPVVVADTLLLAGDHALVFHSGSVPVGPGIAPVPASGQPTPAGTVGGAQTRYPSPIGYGPEITLVDLSGPPRVLSRLRIAGGFLEARQVGSTVRVMVRSGPRIPVVMSGNPADRIAANRSAVEQAGLDAWLPVIRVTTGTTTHSPSVGCTSIVRPAAYSGASLTTVLTLDASRNDLDDPAPMSIVADRDTVYSTSTSLYVAVDETWRDLVPPPGGTVAPTPIESTVYRFDTSGEDRPSFMAAGRVPGWVFGAWGMSERGGDLIVPTTRYTTAQPSGPSPARAGLAATGPVFHTGVYVLRPNGSSLDVVGKVEELAKGQEIAAVRIIDSTVYLAPAFQEDGPLTLVDVSDPLHPTPREKLPLTGYFTYLHPLGPGRLLGIGRYQHPALPEGMYVSLYSLSAPGGWVRQALFDLPNGFTILATDPHAFLYWPPTGLLVLPVLISTDISHGAACGTDPFIGVLYLHVGAGTLDQVGRFSQPSGGISGGCSVPTISRSLVVDNVLWTLSTQGLMASDLTTLHQLAWIGLV
jgi:hypothetical protein